MSAANVLWLPLGELLVERRLLSQVQLELALGEQRRTGLRLGEVLVSMGFVSEEALARMLLEQVGLSSPADLQPEVQVAEEQPAVQPQPDLEPGVAVVWQPKAEAQPPVRANTPVEGVSVEPGGSAEGQAVVEPEAQPRVRVSAEQGGSPGGRPLTEPLPQPGNQYQPEPEPVIRIAPEAQPEPQRTPGPVIVRMDDPGRERGRWWSRNGSKARVRELEKVLSDFEQRSRAIEADIMRVRATLQNLRDGKPT